MPTGQKYKCKDTIHGPNGEMDNLAVINELTKIIKYLLMQPP